MKHNELTLIGGALNGLRVPVKSEGLCGGELFIGDESLRIGVGQGIEIAALASPNLFTFSNITLSNAGATGRYGPTLAQMRSQYKSQDWTQDERFLSRYGQGMQVFTVPTTGPYTFRALGGTRGNITSGAGNCVRRWLTVRAELKKGWKVYVAVGQSGQHVILDSARAHASSGGGGTFVYCPEFSELPIVVAGGAGGMNLTSSRDDSLLSNLSGQAGPFFSSGTLTVPSTTIGRGGHNYATPGYASGGAGCFGTYVETRPGPLLLDNSLHDNSCVGSLPEGSLSTPGGFGGGGGVQRTSDTQASFCGGGGGYTGGTGSIGLAGQQSGGGHGGNFVNPKATLVTNTTINSTTPAHGNCRIELVNPQI